MDGQTYVQSKMRPLKSNKRKNRKSNKNNRISTNKVSNIFHNKNFLIELWQLIFFSSTSIFLILTFLNQAWKPISFDQTKITGLSGISNNDIKQTIQVLKKINLFNKWNSKLAHLSGGEKQLVLLSHNLIQKKHIQLFKIGLKKIKIIVQIFGKLILYLKE